MKTMFGRFASAACVIAVNVSRRRPRRRRGAFMGSENVMPPRMRVVHSGWRGLATSKGTDLRVLGSVDRRGETIAVAQPRTFAEAARHEHRPKQIGKRHRDFRNAEVQRRTAF